MEILGKAIFFLQKEHQMQRLWGENVSAMFKDPKEDSMAEKQLDGGKTFDKIRELIGGKRIRSFHCCHC